MFRKDVSKKPVTVFYLLPQSVGLSFVWHHPGTLHHQLYLLRDGTGLYSPEFVLLRALHWSGCPFVEMNLCPRKSFLFQKIRTHVTCRFIVWLIGFRGDTAPTLSLPAGRQGVLCTNGRKVHASYSRLNELTPVIFVTKGVEFFYAFTNCARSQSSYLIFPRRALSSVISEVSFSSTPK